MQKASNDSLYSAPSSGRKLCKYSWTRFNVDSMLMKFASGGMSGIVSRTICAPFSRLSVLQETRVSVQSATNLIVAEENNLHQTFRSIYQKDGRLSLFSPIGRSHWFFPR